MSMNAMEDATKSAVSHAKHALLSTIKDIPKIPGKLDIPKFSGKPPKIRGLLIFPLREKGKDHVVVPILPSSVSAQDLRSLDDVEKETVGSIEEASPRGSTIEDNTRSASDSEACSSKESTSSLDISSHSNNNSASLWRSFFRLWRQKSMRRLSSFPPRVGVARLSKWRSGKLNRGEGPIGGSDNDFCFFKPSWKSFTTSELKNATNNFSDENLIGRGGFAEVYEGCLEDGQFVAVKRLVKGPLEERTHNFLAELGILVHINHPNIAKLIGVGVEEDLHLVLRLSPHGSLSSLLHGSKGKLEWDVRYKIAIGTAEGLEYLHDRCQRRIIHRDIKAANILLTEDFEPQICDFGLAKWLPDQLTHHTLSSFEGTFGYLAPEYLTHGVVDEKTDVFAFGVLLLELISGRKALDSSQQSLVMWAKPLIDRDEIKELVDPALGESYDYKQLKQLVAAACVCIQHSSMLRPRISEVLTILKGEEGPKSDTSPNVHMHPAPLRRRTYSEELYDAEEYNATRYLNDLNRHKQIALDFRGVNEVPDKGSGECNSE